MKIERMNDKILSYLSQDTYISAKELSNKIHATEKTIRNHIYELNEFVKKHGASIQIKHGRGYRLSVDNEYLFKKIYNNGKITNTEEHPITPEERVDYVICYLLMQTTYVDLLELCEILNVSEATLIVDIRNARDILSTFQLNLHTKRKEGTKIIGDEFNIRLCMENYLETSKLLNMECRKCIQKEKAWISKVVLDVFSEYHVSMPEVSLEKFINHIYISVRRIQNGCEIQKVQNKIGQVDFHEIRTMALRLCEDLSSIFHISFRKEEIDNILIYMIGQRLNKHAERDSNILLSQETLDVVNEAIAFIYRTMNLDFRNDFSLLMDLSVHMLPLMIRLNYGIPVHNPLLSDIKENYALSYTIALQAGIVIEKHYKKKLSEDEVGYLALIFEVSMEKREQKKTYRKKNIVIVCATGKTSSALLAHQYRKMFDDYLDKIHVCNIHELNEMEFHDIDYVFTTTPIHISIPVPIFDIKFTLEHKDVLDIYQKFEKESMKWLYTYYRKEFFFEHVCLDTKEEVLKFMVHKIAKYEPLPVDFYESLMKREEIGPTDFGDFIALPHPYGRVSAHTFASVCVLDKPVFWGNHEVSVVILLSIADNEEDDLDRFYARTSDFMLSHTKAKQFLKHPVYETLLKLLIED